MSLLEWVVMHVVAAGGAAAGAVGAVGAVGDVDEGAVAASVAGLWAGCKSFALWSAHGLHS